MIFGGILAPRPETLPFSPVSNIMSGLRLGPGAVFGWVPDTQCEAQRVRLGQRPLVGPG